MEIVPIYGGADGYLVKAALDHNHRHIFRNRFLDRSEHAAIGHARGDGAKGIVVQGLGWGNVNLPMSMQGGAVMGDDLSPQKPRILLMLLLQNGVSGQKDLQAAFNRGLSGGAGRAE